MASSDAIINADRPSPDGNEASRPWIAMLVHETASGGGSQVPEPLSADIASGEPVEVPPPFVEPVGFDEPPPPPLGQRPPRRNFLAPPPMARAVGGGAAEPPTSAPAAVPAASSAVTVAPLATRVAPAGGRQIPARLLALVQQWRAAATIPQAGPQPRLLYWARWAAAAAVATVAVLYLAGVGPFASAVPFHRSSGQTAVPDAPADRLAYFQRGAQAGDPEAELQFAILYAKGEGVAQDYATAATWFRKAADQGSARAQYDLGVLYERGRGVVADPEQAASWYLKAAEGKYPLAQYNLAVAYTKGQGTRKDLTEAALWYRRAAGQGVVQAMVNLGMLYERGEGVAVSPVDAYAWYLAAGRRGNQIAARRAEDVFYGMARLDQIRAEALASDVADSIHDAPEAGTAPGG
jgi:TPR repeat protein